MHRIKALFRRRSYDESSPVLPERNKARLSHTRRSLDSHRGQQNTKNDHATGPNSSRNKENLVEHKTNGFKSPDSHHPANASSPVAAQSEPRASTEKAPERQRSVLVKRPRKSVSRKEMPGHFYSDNRASTEERPKTSPAEICHSKVNQPIPPTRHQGRAVEIINKDGSTTSSGERSSTEAEKNVIDLRDTVDTDETVTYAPAVTHETVRPHVHEILEEQIYREIHNHDVYHRIQPVYDVEILPARHFVPGPDGRLIEVPEDALPECTGVNQKWHVSKEPPPAPPSLPAPSRPAPHQPETAAENIAVREPMKENVEEEEQGHLEPIKTCTTIDDRDFKDVYSESWQSCAARIF
ncbi:hypothetical protein Daesc_005770 [Daldinia eschscholtzii]|uniref:Uncharacterized protein n=1 Tax=Daldinia eschscholtzii TaxID=292717 RepID=A0AAX6MLW1_9PEZI